MIEVVYSGFRLDLHVDLVDTVSLHSRHCFYHPCLARLKRPSAVQTRTHTTHIIVVSSSLAHRVSRNSSVNLRSSDSPEPRLLFPFFIPLSVSLSTALLSLINPILITRLFLNTLETNAPSEAVSFLFFIPLFNPFPFPAPSQ